MNVYTHLLHGATVDDVLPMLQAQTDAPGNDPVAAYDEAAARVSAAFREPGALDRTVHHPMGDLPGSSLLCMRVTDNLLHGWDLATALSLQYDLDPVVAKMVYDQLAPLGSGLAATGYFTVPRQRETDSMTIQKRLLTLTGR